MLNMFKFPFREPAKMKSVFSTLQKKQVVVKMHFKPLHFPPIFHTFLTGSLSIVFSFKIELKVLFLCRSSTVKFREGSWTGLSVSVWLPADEETA